MIARFIGQINKLDTCHLPRFTGPGDPPACCDPILGLRELKAHLWQVVVEQAHDGLHSQSAFADVENDAAIALTQFDVGERHDLLPQVETSIGVPRPPSDVLKSAGHSLHSFLRSRDYPTSLHIRALYARLANTPKHTTVVGQGPPRMYGNIRGQDEVAAVRSSA